MQRADVAGIGAHDDGNSGVPDRAQVRHRGGRRLHVRRIRHERRDASGENLLGDLREIAHRAENLRVGEPRLRLGRAPRSGKRQLVAREDEDRRAIERVVPARERDELVVDPRIGHGMHEVVGARAQRGLRRDELGRVHREPDPRRARAPSTRRVDSQRADG